MTKIEACTIKHSVTIPLMIQLCDDGYIRLTADCLNRVSFCHLVSALDEFHQRDADLEGDADQITGFTEWISTAKPRVTVGWDWALDVIQSTPVYCRVGAPRSNIMLVDECNHDLGRYYSETILAALLDKLAWQTMLAQQIKTRYS